MNLTPIAITGIIVLGPSLAILTGMAITHKHDEELARIKNEGSTPSDRKTR